MPRVEVRMPPLRREGMTYDRWYADVKGAGATVTRVPTDNGIWSGVVCARFRVPGTDSYFYEVAPLAVRIRDAAQAADGALTQGLGVAADVGDTINDGLLKVAEKLKKLNEDTNPDKLLPWWGKLAIGIGIYGALVQAGIAPPLRKLLK